MRKSQKREKILEIFKNGDLLTAHQVAERLPDIDRATIYRNIALYVEQGILREVNVQKNVSSYEINKEHDYHQHFICNNCNKIIPVDINPEFRMELNLFPENPEDIKKIIPKFLIVKDFELNIKGLCKNCD